MDPLTLIEKWKKGSARRDIQQVRYDIWNDNARDWINQQIDRYFSSQKNRDSIKQFLHLSDNSYKYIIFLLSAVYANPPVRLFVDDIASTELFNTIVGPELDQSMDQVCELTMSANECFVRPKVVGEGREQHIDLQILPAHKVEVLSDGIELLAVAYETDNDTIAYWDKDLFMEYDASTLEPITETVYSHGYGRVPFVCYRRKRPVEGFFLGRSGEDLVELYRLVTIWNAYLNRTGFLQSYTQIVEKVDETLSDFGVTPKRDVEPGPDTILPGEFSTIDLKTDLEKYYRVIQAQKQTVAGNHGISTEVLTHGRMTSGLDRLLQHSSLKEHRQRLIKMFRPSDMSLMKLVAIVWNQDSNSVLRFPEDLRPSINYQEPKLIQSDQDELKELETGMKLGVKTPIDYLLAKDPDLNGNREAAQAILDRNLDEIANVLSRRREYMTPGSNGSDGGRPPKESPDISQSVENTESNKGKETNEVGRH